MSHPRERRLSISLLIGLLAIAPGPAFAEGGGGYPQTPFLPNTQGPGNAAVSYTPGPGVAYAWTTEVIDVRNANFSFTGLVEAGASAVNSLAGRLSFAFSGGEGLATGNGPLSVTNTNTAWSFLKGSNSISVSESTLYVTVIVNGRPVVVAEEVALALSRATKFGTSAAVEVEAPVLTTGGSFAATAVAVSKPVGPR